MTIFNYQAIWIAFVSLAQKTFDDHPMKTSAFAPISGIFSKQNLKVLELRCLRLLDYNLNLSPSVYARYYFELRQIYMSATGGVLYADWSFRRMSRRDYWTLEGRRFRFLREGVSRGIEDVMIGDRTPYIIRSCA